MLYCTYEQYREAGGTLDEAAFDTLCAEAARAATGYAPGVTSVNNDGFAVTFSDGALAEKQAAEAHSILSGCLGHDPHGLLYRGCF